MKTTVNFELTSDEVEKLAAGALTRVAVKLLGGIAASPSFASGFMEGIQMVADYASKLRSTAARSRHVHGAPTGFVGVPPAGYWPPPGQPPPGAPTGWEAAVQQAMDRLRQQPPPQQAAAGPVGPQADNAQPIRETPHIDRCFPIDATRNTEAGVGCHVCATYNGVQRTQCRHCGHVLCHAAPPIVTPPPEPAEGA